MSEINIKSLKESFNCGFPNAQEIFEESIGDASRVLTEAELDDFVEIAGKLCRMGRGVEPVLAFLQEAPQVCEILGAEVMDVILDFTDVFNKTPNPRSIAPFIQSLPAVARRLESMELFKAFLDVISEMMHRTAGSVHGFHTVYASPGLNAFLESIPRLLEDLTLSGIRKWMDYGIKNFEHHPDRQIEFFSLQTPDSLAVMKRERHGVLFVNIEMCLDKYTQALWGEQYNYMPYSLKFDELRKPVPYSDKLGIHLPDVMDDLVADAKTGMGDVVGIDGYIALVSHVIAHKKYGEWAFADNFGPFQRVSMEVIEDSRVEYLAMQKYPGLRKIWLAMHPKPVQNACDDEHEACINHRLAMFSRAVLDPDYHIEEPVLASFVERFFELMKRGNTGIKDSIDLGIQLVVKTRKQSDNLPRIYFDNTVVPYRDDNRHMWKFHEEDDEADDFDQSRAKTEGEDDEEEFVGIPRHYDEWDYQSETYRPDWVTLYESLHPSGDVKVVDAILEKHKSLIKQLKMILDRLKPQNYVRVRYQEEGSELDLDVAIKSLIDFKSGANPDPRINMSHKHDGRDLSVMILLDLSQSINQKVAGSNQTILQLSQEAVTILSWAIQELGDGFAIAGFHSDTRHQVRYYAIKGFSEQWDDTVKARLSSMQAALSTRMGAAMRHAGHYLEHQTADKKLMLILTDGEPADVDMANPEMLIEDARMAKIELQDKAIYSYCINLDPKADDYVERIFGNHYTIVDNIERLPEKMAEVFISLTG